MNIEESFAIDAPIETVWASIRNPDVVGPCIPGCQSVEAVDDTTYRVEITVAVGPIKTRFKADVTITEETPPTFIAATTRGEEGGKASTLNARSTLALSTAPDGATVVTYTSEVSVFGRLGKFGLGIMKKKAKSMGEEFAAALRTRIAEEPATSAG